MRTLMVLVSIVAASLTPVPAQAAPTDDRPNFVVIMTDDMRADDLEYMPHTRRLLGQLQLSDFVSNHPLCCPARAELITGQYAQNNGVHHNGGAYGAYSALRDPDNTLATWLDDAGYATSLVGKFMNGWNPEQGTLRQRGWDNLDVIYGEGAYHPYRYAVYQEAAPPTHPGIYTNDYVSQQTVARVREAATTGEPFFVWSSYVAPHGMVGDDGRWRGAVPAPRHAGLFRTARPPFKSDPSWEPIRTDIGTMTATWRARLRSLQSVDEGVRDTVRAVRSEGELDETVFVFTSDNGYLLGEHGLSGKNEPYEESLRVPLLARGPGVASGVSAKGASLVDIAPSIAALAGVTPGRAVDGRSDLFALDPGWKQVLIQGGHPDGTLPWWWRGVREARWVYWRYVDGREVLFNRQRDPHQLTNLIGKRPKVERRLERATPPP